MAIALNLNHPAQSLAHHGSPSRRRSHLHLVVSPPANQHYSHRAPAAVYRRRRIGVAVVALSLLAVAMLSLVGVFGGSVRADENSPRRVSAPNVVIAQPGDTLWAIARRITPVGSITHLVDQLVLMNGDEITAGQEVRLP